MVDEEVRAAEAFSAVLHTLRKRVSGALISESCWDSIHELTGGIPFDACAMFGLELHLSDPDPFAEPNVPLKLGTLLSKHYCGEGAARIPGCSMAAIAAYLGSGNDANAVGWGRTRYGNLGFDRSQLPPNGPPIPAVSLLVAYSEPIEKAARLAACAVRQEASERELAGLRRVHDAFRAAPDDTLAVGVYPARSPRVFHLYSQPLPPEAASGILERAGWPGPAGSVAEALGSFDLRPFETRLSLEVTEQGLSRRLGVEFAPIDRADPSRLGCRGWEPLVAKLASDGICLPGKAQGLLAWPGFELVFRGPHCIRWYSGFSHFKIVFEAASDGAPAIRAKAYTVTAYLPFE